MEEFLKQVSKVANREVYTGQDFECSDLHGAAVRYGQEIDSHRNDVKLQVQSRFVSGNKDV